MANDIPPIVLEFKSDIAGIKDALVKVENELKKFDKNAEHSGKATKDLSAKTVAAGAVMAAVFQKVAKDVFKFGKEFVTTYQDIGGEVRKMRLVLGGSAEDMSRLRFAAEHLGVGSDKLIVGMRILSKHLVANDDAAKALGITYRDSGGQLLPMTDIMSNLSDRFKSMPNGLEKTALAVKAFGRNATTLLPLLNKGSDGLKELYENADKLGLTLSGADLQATKDYTLKQRELHSAVQGLQLAIGRNLVPQLSKLATFVMEHVVPQLQSFVNGLLGTNGLTGAVGKAGDAAQTWGTRLRGLIGIIRGMRTELGFLAVTLGGIFVVKKIWAGIVAITAAVTLMKNAIVFARTQTLALAGAEALASSGKFVTAWRFITTAIGFMTGATAAATVAQGAQAIAAGGAALATGVEAAAMTGLATAASAAAAANTAVIVTEDVLSGGAFSVAQAAGLALAGLAVTGIAALVVKAKHEFNKATTVPTYIPQPGEPGFIGPVYDPTIDPNSPEYINLTPPDLTGGNGGGGAVAGQTLAQSLAEQARRRTATRRLRGMGASAGLIDAVLNSAEWEKEYGKILRGGTATLRNLQTMFNKTDAGQAEVFTKAHRANIDKVSKEATTVYRKYGVDLSKATTTESKLKIAKDFMTSLNPLITAAKLEEKKTRGTDLHAKAEATLTKVLNERATAQKKINELTGKATKETEKQTQAITNLTGAQQQNTSWLAAHGINANANNQGTVVVPVVIDGHEVFRVVQKYSNQNNRRNVTTGIGLSGAVI